MVRGPQSYLRQPVIAIPANPTKMGQVQTAVLGLIVPHHRSYLLTLAGKHIIQLLLPYNT